MYKFLSIGFVCVLCVVLDWSVLVQAINRNNVCKNLNDYLTIYSNKNCWYNPDVWLPVESIVKRNGYHLEKYTVTTKDGYLLNLFRIVKNLDDLKNNRKPILLQHGISITAAAFVLIGKKSLAFFLVDQGFDVWLSNFRGTKYSLGHLNYTTNNPDYWNFSFHEMAVYDLPAQLDFIAATIKHREKILYMGHSMGTTMSFIYASLRRRHAKKHLKAIISMAPVAYMRSVRSILKIVVPFLGDIENFIHVMGLDGLLMHPELQQGLIKLSCNGPALIQTCQVFHMLLAGFSDDQLAAENLPVFFNHFFTGTSLNTLKHFAQIIGNNGRFQWFDYGPELNQISYNSTVPFEYDVSKISLPVHLFVGRNDYLADVDDASVLFSKLQTEKTMTIVSKNGMYDFAHNDFLLGRHVEIFYELLMNLLNKY